MTPGQGEVMALKGVVMTLDEGHMMETINGKSEAASEVRRRWVRCSL